MSAIKLTKKGAEESRDTTAVPCQLHKHPYKATAKPHGPNYKSRLHQNV